MARRITNWAGVWLGTLLGVLAAYQQFKLPPVLPLLAERYGYSRILAGSFMSIYAVLGLLFSVWAGRRVQQRGLGPTLLLAFGLMISGNALGLIAPESGALMLLSRALEGGSYAVLALVGPVLANASASQRHLPIAFALTAAWIPNGQIAAGLLSGLFIAQETWKPLWLIGIGATCALAVWTVYLLKRDRLSSVSMLRPEPSTTPLTRAQRRALMLSAGTFMLWSTQYFAFMTWLPTFLVEVHGANPTLAVHGYLVPVATLLAFVYVAGFLIRAGVPIMPLLAATLLLQASVWLLVPFVEGDAAGIVLLILWGIGAGITPTCLFGLPTTIATEPAQRPQAFGIVLTGRNLGVLMGPLLLGGILTLTADWTLASPLFATVTAMGTGLAMALIYQQRTRKPATSA